MTAKLWNSFHWFIDTARETISFWLWLPHISYRVNIWNWLVSQNVIVCVWRANCWQCYFVYCFTEIPRPLGAELHTPHTTIGPTASPVHAIAQSASAMSRGIVGALKGVGGMLHSSVQEGQIASGSTNPPPWGVVDGKNGSVSALPHSESIDSAKEASPGNVPSPSSEGSGKGVVTQQTDHIMSLDRTEPEEILTVEIYETLSEHLIDDVPIESVSQEERVDDGATAALGMCEEHVAPSTGEVMLEARSHLPEKFLAVGDDPYEDIVFSSHTKNRKKKKAKLADAAGTNDTPYWHFAS